MFQRCGTACGRYPTPTPLRWPGVCNIEAPTTYIPPRGGASVLDVQLGDMMPAFESNDGSMFMLNSPVG